MTLIELTKQKIEELNEELSSNEDMTLQYVHRITESIRPLYKEICNNLEKYREEYNSIVKVLDELVEAYTEHLQKNKKEDGEDVYSLYYTVMNADRDAFCYCIYVAEGEREVVKSLQSVKEAITEHNSSCADNKVIQSCMVTIDDVDDIEKSDFLYWDFTKEEAE